MSDQITPKPRTVAKTKRWSIIALGAVAVTLLTAPLVGYSASAFIAAPFCISASGFDGEFKGHAGGTLCATQPGKPSEPAPTQPEDDCTDEERARRLADLDREVQEAVFSNMTAQSELETQMNSVARSTFVEDGKYRLAPSGISDLFVLPDPITAVGEVPCTGPIAADLNITVIVDLPVERSASGRWSRAGVQTGSHYSDQFNGDPLIDDERRDPGLRAKLDKHRADMIPGAEKARLAYEDAIRESVLNLAK